MAKLKNYWDQDGLFMVDRSPFVYRGEEVDNILRASSPDEEFAIRPVTNPEKVYRRRGRAISYVDATRKETYGVIPA